MSASPLPSWLVSALPEQLRAHVRSPPGPRRAGELTLIFEVPGQPPRTFDAYLLSPGQRALVQRAGIGFGYRVGEGPVDHGAEASFCKTVAAALCNAAADALASHLREPIDEPTPPPEPADHEQPEGAELLVNEYTLTQAGLDAALVRVRAVAGPIREVELFLVSACVQSCSFCVYPRVRGTAHQHRPSPDAVAWLRAILDELRARPGPSEVVLSGPDCLRHPQIDAMLELFADEHDVGLQLLGPLTRLSERALCERVAELPSLRGVRMSLFGARPETHDRVVGTRGAHAQVLAALRHCCELGVEVGLATVLTPDNVAELPELLALVRELGLRTQLNLYHPESWSGTPLSWREIELERVIVAPEQLLGACERLDERDAAVGRARYIAHCWLPARLRAVMLDHGPARHEDFDHAAACRSCAAYSRCVGISRPALVRLGPGCARPIA